MTSEDTSVPTTCLLIQGEHRSASNNKLFEVRNPYSGALVGCAAAATSDDCREAIESCGKALNQWERTPLRQRRDILLKAAELLTTERYVEKVAIAVREETAAPDHAQKYNAYVGAEYLRTAAGMISELKGETFPSQLPGGQLIAVRRAVGVVWVTYLFW